MERNNKLAIDNARIIFKNFTGKDDKFGREGDRSFSIVIEDDTLTDPMCSGDSTENHWYTPVYFLPPWSDRRLIQELCKLMKGDTNEKV